MMNYQKRIISESNRQSGIPCIRDLDITIYEILSQLAKGMSKEEILEKYPKLEAEDITACLQFAADQKDHLYLAENLVLYGVMGFFIMCFIMLSSFYGVLLLLGKGEETFIDTINSINSISSTIFIFSILSSNYFGTWAGVKLRMRKTYTSKDIEQFAISTAMLWVMTALLFSSIGMIFLFV